MKAFIVGNGPSLTLDVIDRIKHYPTFATGAIGAIFDKIDWRPTFYAAMTSFIAYDHFKKDIESAFEHSMMVLASKQYVGYEGNAVFTEAHEEKIWSDNPYEAVSKYGSSLIVNIQWAEYLGFEKLYLVGCDGYKAGHDHFKGYPVHKAFRLEAMQEKLMDAHRFVKENTKVEIMNLTPGSVIDAYPKGKIEDVT